MINHVTGHFLVSVTFPPKIVWQYAIYFVIRTRKFTVKRVFQRVFMSAHQLFCSLPRERQNLGPVFMYLNNSKKVIRKSEVSKQAIWD